MPIEPKTFDVGSHTFRFTPWSAFSAASEWGEIVGDWGEGVLEHLLDGGDVAGLLSALQDESSVTVLVLQTVIRALGDIDLGDRVGHYLTSGRVEVSHGDVWLDLYGPDADEHATEAGLDGLDVLSAAWHVVRDGLRPLSGRLSSLGLGPVTKSTPLSSPNAATV